MTAPHKTETTLVTGTQNQQIPASQIKVLVDGETQPRALGQALQLAGGVSSLIAGTNITLDPPSGVGAVIVNSTGGGGTPTDLANDPDTTTGLTYGYKAGRVLVPDGSSNLIAAGTVVLPDDEDSRVIFNTLTEAVEVIDAEAIRPPTLILLAAVTTAGGAITAIEDQRVFLDGRARFFQSAIADGGFASANGLDFTVANDSGSVLFSNSRVGIESATVTLTDDATNYVELLPNGDVSANTTAFTLGNLPLAQVVTESGQVTQVLDRRPFASVPGVSIIGTNTAAGTHALEDNVATNNTAFGDSAAANTSSGSANTAVGTGALQTNTVGINNVAVGFNALNANLSDDNVGIGHNAATASDVNSNAIAIGSGAVAPASNTAQIGNGSVMRLGVGPETAKIGNTVVTTAQFDKTNDTTLANIPGLSANVVAGGTYTFGATLFTVSDVGTGVKAAIAGTCTATSIIYEGTLYAAGISVASGATRTTTKGNVVASLTTTTVARIDITGTIVVANAGTLTVQFAENAAIALTTSSVLINSKFQVTRVS